MTCCARRARCVPRLEVDEEAAVIAGLAADAGADGRNSWRRRGRPDDSPSSCWRATSPSNEMSWAPSVMPNIMPVSCCGEEALRE